MRTIKAIMGFLTTEGDLLEVDINERTLTHKLAEHLARRFRKWHVDCEYNRNEDEGKRLPFCDEVSTGDTEGRTIYPDIIVHKRRTTENLIVVEVKKTTNKEVKNDIWKLEGLTKSGGGYAYRCGLHLIVDCESKTIADAKVYVAGSRDDELSEWFRHAYAVTLNDM